jgi:hypothetical protein
MALPLEFFRTKTVEDLAQEFPNIPVDTIREIFLSGYDNHQAKINDRIFELFAALKDEDAGAYKDRILSLYMRAHDNSEDFGPL